MFLRVWTRRIVKVCTYTCGITTPFTALSFRTSTSERSQRTVSNKRMRDTIPVHTKGTEIEDCDAHWCLLYKGEEFAKKQPEIRIRKWPPLSMKLKKGHKIIRNDNVDSEYVTTCNHDLSSDPALIAQNSTCLSNSLGNEWKWEVILLP